jgi:ATP-dependent Lon protease
MDDVKVNFSKNILEYLIENYTNEAGVRKIKEILNDIMLEINLRRLEDNKILGKKIKSIITITEEMIEKDFLKKKSKIVDIKINQEPLVGLVNGLWANELGVGGLIPIESCWIPSTDKFNLELTGMQGNVMKESMKVAKSVAWRILPDYIKSRLNEKWKDTLDFGIHIHCPDGSTPKDGPSAGGAITTCLISLLTGTKVSNQVAITGEINLKGHITKIGGLEEKIFGAKKAEVKLVLCPRENSKDLDEIIEKFPNLFDINFQAKLVDNIWDILREIIIEHIDWVRFD